MNRQYHDGELIVPHGIGGILIRVVLFDDGVNMLEI